MSEYAHPSLGTVRIVPLGARPQADSQRPGLRRDQTDDPARHERTGSAALFGREAGMGRAHARRFAARLPHETIGMPYSTRKHTLRLEPCACIRPQRARIDGELIRVRYPADMNYADEPVQEAIRPGNRAGVENRGTAIPARTRGRAVPRTGIPLRKSDRPQQPHALGQLLVEKRPLAEPPSDETARPADRLYPDPRAVPYAAPKSRPRLPCLARSNDRRKTQAAAKRAERLFDPVGPMIPCDGFRLHGTRRAGNREAARTMSAPCRRSSLAETSLNRKEQGDRETADSDLFTQPRNSL